MPVLSVARSGCGPGIELRFDCSAVLSATTAPAPACSDRAGLAARGGRSRSSRACLSDLKSFFDDGAAAAAAVSAAAAAAGMLSLSSRRVETSDNRLLPSPPSASVLRPVWGVMAVFRAAERRCWASGFAGAGVGGSAPFCGLGFGCVLFCVLDVSRFEGGAACADACEAETGASFLVAFCEKAGDVLSSIRTHSIACSHTAAYLYRLRVRNNRRLWLRRLRRCQQRIKLRAHSRIPWLLLQCCLEVCVHARRYGWTAQSSASAIHASIVTRTAA